MNVLLNFDTHQITLGHQTFNISPYAFLNHPIDQATLFDHLFKQFPASPLAIQLSILPAPISDRIKHRLLAIFKSHSAQIGAVKMKQHWSWTPDYTAKITEVFIFIFFILTMGSIWQTTDITTQLEQQISVIQKTEGAYLSMKSSIIQDTVVKNADIVEKWIYSFTSAQWQHPKISFLANQLTFSGQILLTDVDQAYEKIEQLKTLFKGRYLDHQEKRIQDKLSFETTLEI